MALNPVEIHSPTNWVYHMEPTGAVIWSGPDARTTVAFDVREADAARIVKCVNHHDELVAALKAAHADLLVFMREVQSVAPEASPMSLPLIFAALVKVST